MKKYFKIFFILVLILICSKVYALESEYTIDSYDVNIKVNENDVLNITENIKANFDVYKHGIIRKIPTVNTVTRLDGTTEKNRASIKDINVDEQFSTYNESGYRVIKIGDPNNTITGTKDYIISYTYNLGKDKTDKFDELYFNIIGTEWDTSVSNVTFKIKMPKEFDESKIGFSHGSLSSTDSSNITYSVNNNTITGNYNGVLSTGEGLNIRLELPEGYFKNFVYDIDITTILSIIIPIVFVLVSFLIWYKYGRDEKVIETVEFYPPEGFNSAEIGFLYKGNTETTDVVSLLIYLANKGYIKISETEEKVLFSKVKGFKITKLKDYDGDNTIERMFLDGLFSPKLGGIITGMKFSEAISMIKNPEQLKEKVNESTKSPQEVTSSSLYNNFYITLNQIIKYINSKENKEKIFEKSSLSKNIFVILMIIITFVLITFKPIMESGGTNMLLIALIFPGIGLSVLFGALVGAIKMPKWFAIIWGVPFGGIPWATMVLPALLVDPIYLIAYIIGIICIILMLILKKYMPRRTKNGNEILGKLKGFKNFLETAEKPKLEELVMENPSYFYNILPFTYVLGVSDKWIKKFETIALQAPNWYEGTGSFNSVTFGSFISSTMTSASSAMASSPSSDGGGSSGGGSSGGGSGGGGGSSW